MIFSGKKDSWSRLPTSRAGTGWIFLRLPLRLKSGPRRRHSRLPRPTTFLQSCGQDKFWAPQSSNLKVRPARDIFNHRRLPDAGESLRISDGPDIDHLAEAGPLDPDPVA